MKTLKRTIAAILATVSTTSAMASMAPAFAYEDISAMQEAYIASLEDEDLIKLAQLSFEDGNTMEETEDLVDTYAAYKNSPVALDDDLNDFYRTDGKSSGDHYIAIINTNIANPVSSTVRYTINNNAASFLNKYALVWGYNDNSQAAMSFTYNNSTDVQTSISSPVVASHKRIIGRIGFNITNAASEREAYNAISQQILNGNGYITYATYVRGDVNHDGVVNEIDSKKLTQYLIKKIPDLNFEYLDGTASPYASDINFLAADFDEDNTLSTRDVININKNLE